MMPFLMQNRDRNQSGLMKMCVAHQLNMLIYKHIVTSNPGDSKEADHFDFMCPGYEL